MWKALKDERSSPRDTVRITKGEKEKAEKTEVSMKIKLSEMAFLVEDWDCWAEMFKKVGKDKKEE